MRLFINNRQSWALNIAQQHVFNFPLILFSHIQTSTLERQLVIVCRSSGNLPKKAYTRKMATATVLATAEGKKLLHPSLIYLEIQVNIPLNKKVFFLTTLNSLQVNKQHITHDNGRLTLTILCYRSLVPDNDDNTTGLTTLLLNRLEKFCFG